MKYLIALLMLGSSNKEGLYDSFVFIPGFDFPEEKTSFKNFKSVWKSDIADFTSMITGVKNHCLYADRIFQNGNRKYSVNAAPCVSKKSLKNFSLVGTGPDYVHLFKSSTSYSSDSKVSDGGYVRFDLSDKKLTLRYRFNRTRKTSISFIIDWTQKFLFLKPDNKKVALLQDLQFNSVEQIFMPSGKTRLLRFNDRGEFRYLLMEVVSVDKESVLLNYAFSSRSRIPAPGIRQLFRWDVSTNIFLRRLLKIAELKFYFLLKNIDLGYIDEYRQFLYISKLLDLSSKENLDFKTEFNLLFLSFKKRYKRKLLQAGSNQEYTKVPCYETDLSALPDDVSVVFSGNSLLIYLNKQDLKGSVLSKLSGKTIFQSRARYIEKEGVWILTKKRSFLAPRCYQKTDFVDVNQRDIKIYAGGIIIDNIFQIRYLLKKHFYRFK
ncbi:hypothetical protein KKF34_10825 [Myxococcota bacterium]|nr:hypothetical protein [Myxococcota bacterium]MBU1382816.1 hypothetical protein [Myxococcota bacterium]MBU1497361.1 hypothetical protein [Myxococcota bacterium]